VTGTDRGEDPDADYVNETGGEKPAEDHPYPTPEDDPEDPLQVATGFIDEILVNKDFGAWSSKKFEDMVNPFDACGLSLS